MSNLEWLTNTDDANWRDWCKRDGACKGAPKETDKHTADELRAMGMFGIWAPKKQS
jgi:hypothetical protein